MDFLGTGTNGGNFTLGITELSYNASDAAGNTDVCQFVVIVQRSSARLDLCFFDNDPPIVTCQNVTANSTFPNSLLELIEDFDYTYMDENPYNKTNGTRIRFNFNIGPDGDLLPPGHIPVELIAQDNCGEEATCLFYVENTHTDPPILTYTDPPILTCSNVALHLDTPNTFSGLTNGTTYTYQDASADPNGVTYNVSEDDLFPPGYTPVTLLAVDAFNNSDSCLFYLQNTLTELPVDCPNLNRTISTDPDQATYTFNPDFGADNVTKSVDGYRYHGGDVSVNLTLGGSPVGSSVSIGTHAMIALIYDDELSKTCTGIYIVKDTDPPILTCSNVALHLDTPNTFSGLTNGTTYTYQDASADPNGVTYNVSEDDPFPPGYTPVTLVAVDAFNNSDSCLFYVHNTLTELPVNCPDFDRTMGTDPEQATYTFSPDFGADDVVKSVGGYRYHGGGVSVNLTLGGSPVGGGVSIGTHDVIALIYDDELNKTCTGTYRVQDDEAPVIMCSNLTVPFGNVVANYDAVVSDNVDEPSSLRVDFAPTQPGQRLDPGVNEISATVTDSAGNINSTVCYINIQMTELPVEILQASAVYDGNTYSLFFRGHLNEGLTSLNFSFYGDVKYDPIVINGVEQFQPADLSPGVNNIRIEATDGVLSKTFKFVLNVASNQPVNHELTGNMVLARIKGTDAIFTQDLFDDTTTTFKNLALELQANLDKIYQNTPGFIGSRVVSFRIGSIIANFILIFNPTTSLSEIEAIDIFRSALTSEAEITSGSGLFLTSLPAFNIFLPCEDLTCENSGTCIITSDGSGAECRCTESWTGDRCQTSTNIKSTSIAVIVGTTAGVLLFFILIPILVLFVLALRNRMMMKDQSSQVPAGTRDYNHGDHRMPSRGIPIFHHEDRSRDLSFCNDKVDMALFTQYKSREQRSVSRNFNNGPSFTGRAPSHETLQNGNHRRNGIPLRDTYYYSGQMYL
eukprot:XP_011660752.1 PREDICTED: uncharacterized protein LOC105436661 [Strongylocentrotus purpuratus]